MTPCPGSALPAIGLRPYRARLAAAVCASVLLHVMAAHRLTGGPAGDPLRAVPPSMPLAATLVPRLPEEPAPEALPVQVEPEDVRDVVTPRAPRKPTRPQPRTESAAPERAQPPGHAALEGPDPNVYAARDLDTYPALTRALDLRYAGVAGRALLIVTIDEIGIVQAVSVIEGEPAGALAQDAVRAFLAAQFTPARRNGRAVKSRVTVQVTFGAEADAK